MTTIGLTSYYGGEEERGEGGREGGDYFGMLGKCDKTQFHS